MTSAFENLNGPNKPLRAEPPDKREFEGLVRSGHARLRDALNESLSIESRFDLGPAVWRVLDKCHNIRNLGEYEGDLNVDDRVVTDLVAACQAVSERVDALRPLT